MADKSGPNRETDAAANRYWRSNLVLVSVLLTVWFVVAFVLSIFLIDRLNEVTIGKVGLGFWMAQQGSIYVFVLLVLIYALVMDQLDKRAERGPGSAGGGK